MYARSFGRGTVVCACDFLALKGEVLYTVHWSNWCVRPTLDPALHMLCVVLKRCPATQPDRRDSQDRPPGEGFLAFLSLS